MMCRRVARNAAFASALVTVVSARARADQPSNAETKQQCIAGSEQGQSDRDEGRYRSARKAFFECARAVCPRVIADSCTKWLRELDDSAPTIVLGANDEHGNDLTDVNVTFDGVLLTSRLDGKPVEVDAGEHVLRFQRTGSDTVQQKLVLRAGDKARGLTVTLRSSGATGTGGLQVERSEGGRSEPLLSPHHVTAASLGLSALVAAGAGAYFIARSDEDRGNAANLRSGLPSNACTHVPSVTCQSLSNAVDSQHREANVASFLLVGAATLAAGAAVSWFAWPTPRDTPRGAAWLIPVPGGAAAGIGGRFR
ncbi:MAG: hypothetical protein M3O50_08070 [Myxococcota bacterium]|nr:hypothetical protein [Myxococcota bacterium]